jgi:CheY-like chemotaxis protein
VEFIIYLLGKLSILHGNILKMVYLVDDDEDDIDFVKEALFIHSYKGPVDTANNGMVLLEKLEKPQANPDVIVMDLNMPVKNGFDTLQEIKNHPVLKDIPVIILTASANKKDEARCFDLGCNYYYSKPLSLKDYVPIVHMVKRIVSKSAL